jgi:hypothetical protein
MPYRANGSRLNAIAAILVLVGASVPTLLLYAVGSVMVRDADDVVAAVSFRDSETRVSITRLPGGLYASLNKL